MTAITATGFERTRLDERLTQLQDIARGIFGSDIDLDPNSIDGQYLGVLAETISNLDQLAEAVYYQFNPTTAFGSGLSLNVQLNSIRRISGRQSQVTLRYVGIEGTTIPAQSLVKTPIGEYYFSTDSDAVIPSSGFIDVTAKSVSKADDGTISILYTNTSHAANSLTKIVTPLFGVQTVTNPAAVVVGRLEEKDDELRIRRRKSTAAASSGLVEGIQGSVDNLSNVVKSRIYQNRTDSVDANLLPPHSFYLVVLGGSNDEIADILWKKETLGVTQVGSVSVTVTDSKGFPHVMKFSRPASKRVYVTVNTVQKPGWPTNGADLIKQAIVDYAAADQEIGEELIHTRLFSPANSVPGHSVTSIFSGTSASPSGTANIAALFDELITIDLADIVVNVS